MIPNIQVTPRRAAWPIAAAAAAFFVIQVLAALLNVPFPGSTAIVVFLGGAVIFLILNSPANGVGTQGAAVAAGSWVAAVMVMVLINQEFLMPLIQSNHRSPIVMLVPVPVAFVGACVFGFLLRSARSSVSTTSILIVAGIWAGMRLVESLLFTMSGTRAMITVAIALAFAVEGATVIWLARQ